MAGVRASRTKLAPLLVTLLAALAARAAHAQSSPPPDAGAADVDFLEYLGSWQGADDEWVLIADWEKGAAGETGPAPDHNRDRSKRKRDQHEDD